MASLTPRMSAYAADNVYRIISNVDVSRRFHSSLLNSFELSSASRFEGTAGALVFKYRSGFGVIARGKGEFQGDALLAIRGTDDLVRDLVFTDLNMSVQLSSTGRLVHGGFNKTFNSFYSQHVRPFLRKFHPNQVHCVGHSLGGALATLTADRIAVDGLAKPVLYTFGSPRVGGEPFARQVTAKLGAENIHRVYHKTDIVSMVPMWPFVHVPNPGIDCYINSPGAIPWITYHDMEKYIDSVTEHNWEALHVAQPKQDFDHLAKVWLNRRIQYGITTASLMMFHYTLVYLLKKIVYATGVVVQAGLASSLTLLDMLAQALAKGAQASKEILSEVKGLMMRVLSMLGNVGARVVDVTVDFIRRVLTALARRVYEIANAALQMVHRV